MAPTICPGKKRQTRQGQGSHKLNKTLSSIVDYATKYHMNSQLSASLRLQTHKTAERNNNNKDNINSRSYFYNSNNNEADVNNNHIRIQNRFASAANRRRQDVFFVSDNAVTSSGFSDRENAVDLPLVNGNESAETCIGFNRNSLTNSPFPFCQSSMSSSVTAETSFLSATPIETASSSSSSLQKEKGPLSPLPVREERKFERYLSIIHGHSLEEDSSDNKITANLNGVDSDGLATSGKGTEEIHSSNAIKNNFGCNDSESENEEDENDIIELNCVVNNTSIGNGMYEDSSETDMETDSMTSLDTEKSAKLKSAEPPILRDKLIAKQHRNNTRSINGLLSIAIKTIKLVKRNQLLQERLTQLQLETSEFIKSVLANPENRHFREHIHKKAQKIDNI